MAWSLLPDLAQHISGDSAILHSKAGLKSGVSDPGFLMKLVCTQTDLNTYLSLVSRAVPSRPTHPVLANVLLTADTGTQRVSLTAFDLSLGIQASFPTQVDASGAITLPAKLLNDIVSRLPSDTQITLDDEAGGEITLTSNFGRYRVRGLPADEFPELPLAETAEAVHLMAEALIDGLRGSLFAASVDETKQVLMGVHLKVQADSLEFAATDGHRLAVVTTTNQSDPAAVPPTTEVRASPESEAALEPFEVTVPGRALRDLERILATRSTNEPIALYFDHGQVVFQWGDQYLTSRTLEGQYPNYHQLIPKQFGCQITIERKLLLGALERIAVLADQKNNLVKMILDGTNQQVHLAVEAQDVGSGQESIPAQISGDSSKVQAEPESAPNFEIAFNVRYLMDGLKVFPTPEVQMQLNTATSPVILTPLGVLQMTYLVMPVQIRD